MGAQSFIMMYMAGEAWQYGKRKISAMTNEEFNKLSPLQLLKEQQSTLKEAIPSIEQSMKDMTPMVQTITAEMIKAIPEIATGLVTGIEEASGTSTSSGTLGVSAVGEAQIGIASDNVNALVEVFTWLGQALAAGLSNEGIIAAPGTIAAATEVSSTNETALIATIEAEQEALALLEK